MTATGTDATVQLQLSDVLAAPSELTLPGSTPEANLVTAPVPTVDPLLAVKPKTTEEDELNRQPPLI